MKKILLLFFCSVTCIASAQENHRTSNEVPGVKGSYTFTYEDYRSNETFYPQGIQKQLGDEWVKNALNNPEAYHLSATMPNFLITFDGTEIVNFFKGKWCSAFYPGNAVYVDHKRSVRVFYPH